MLLVVGRFPYDELCGFLSRDICVRVSEDCVYFAWARFVNGLGGAPFAGNGVVLIGEDEAFGV